MRCKVCGKTSYHDDCDFCMMLQIRAGKRPILTPPGWKPVRVEFVTSHDVDLHPTRYNSNFHRDIAPVECRVNGVSSWLTPETAKLMAAAPWASVEIGGADLSELLRLGKLAQFRKLHHTLVENDALLAVAAKIDDAIAAAGKTGARMFARLNECSFKHSDSFGYAFLDGRQILRAFVEDSRARGWLELCGATSATLWLSDFDDRIQTDNEFRVFIYKGVVTGISQYDWQNASPTLYELSEAGLETLGGKIRDFALNAMRTLMEAHRSPSFETWNVVVDVALVEGSPRLIEFTSFGGHTGCGSALFHWKRDEGILYASGSSRTAVFRVIHA